MSSTLWATFNTDCCCCRFWWLRKHANVCWNSLIYSSSSASSEKSHVSFPWKRESCFGQLLIRGALRCRHHRLFSKVFGYYTMPLVQYWELWKTPEEMWAQQLNQGMGTRKICEEARLRILRLMWTMQYDLVNIENNPVRKLQRYFGLQRAEYRRILPGKSGPDITGELLLEKVCFYSSTFLKLCTSIFTTK